MSIKHNKKRIPLLNLPVNSISARSAPQILPIKGDCTFSFLNFRIIGLCNSSANSLLEYFLNHYQKFFHQNIYKPLKQDLFDIHQILDL